MIPEAASPSADWLHPRETNAGGRIPIPPVCKQLRRRSPVLDPAPDEHLVAAVHRSALRADTRTALVVTNEAGEAAVCTPAAGRLVCR